MQPKTYIDLGDGVQRDASAVTHPSDRTFRNAWAFNGSVIDVDMTKARSIHRDDIRRERIQRFDSFDKVALPLTRKAAAGGTLTTQEQTDLNAAENGAQKLRDAPDDLRIDAAVTPDDLKALTLEVLTA